MALNAQLTSGVYQPQDFNLKTINFVASNGSKIDLRQVMVELSIFEDIYSFSMSGYVLVTDAQGLIGLLQITGNEFIELEYGKFEGSPDTNKQTFRVYKVDSRNPSGNQNQEYFAINFCSEELMLSEQTKISKSYKGQKISQIVNGIMTDKLKVDPSKIQNIEETVGVYDFVVPRLKPFEAISWLSMYARPASTNLVGADMLFYETRYGYNFRSLQSLYKQDVYNTYKYQQQNLKDQTMQDKMSSVLKYELVKSFDSLDDVNAGAFSNRLVSIDPLTRSYKITDFSLTDYRSKSSSLNPDAPTNITKNRLGVTQDKSYDANFKVSISNPSETLVPYINDRSNSTTKDMFIEATLPTRTAQIALANYTVMKIMVPGDPGICVGKTIQLNLLSIKPTSTEKQLDDFYSGKYLVTAVRHVMQAQGVYQCVLEISKDSSTKSYSTGNPDSAAWKMINNE